jgi:sensor histidine kinase YesM
MDMDLGEVPDRSIQSVLGRLLRQRYARQFWLLQFGGWLGLAIVGFFSLNLWYNQPELSYLGHTLLQSAIGLLISWPLRHIYRRIWVLPPAPRLLVMLLAVLVASVLWAVVRLVLFEYMTGESGLWADFGGWLYSSIFIFLCWTALYHGLKYYRLAELEHSALQDMVAARDRAAAQAAEARSTAREAELTMLRYQLNPHFLFNTLNAVQSLVASRRTDEATSMIAALSDFLRFSLYTDAQKLIPVAEEIEAIRQYLQIEQARFRDRLRVRIEVAPDAGHVPVPSMLLQPLVENAIKYAVAPSEGATDLDIHARCSQGFLEVDVSDSGCAEAPRTSINGNGVGLKNIRQRLASIYSAEASLKHIRRDDGGMTARVSIPLGDAAACG